jgi:hypothetical protein
MPAAISDEGFAKLQKTYGEGEPELVGAIGGVREYVNNLQQSLAPIIETVAELAQEASTRRTESTKAAKTAYEKDLTEIAGPSAKMYGIGVDAKHQTPAMQQTAKALGDLGRAIFDAAQAAGKPIDPKAALKSAHELITQQTATKPDAVKAVESTVKKLARKATIPPGTAGSSGQADTALTREARIASASKFY